MSLADLPNLGERSAAMLAEAGIVARKQLEELGPVRAYLAAKQAGTKPGLNLLWAIAGALTDTRWDQLPEDCKDRLRDELAQLS